MWVNNSLANWNDIANTIKLRYRIQIVLAAAVLYDHLQLWISTGVHAMLSTAAAPLPIHACLRHQTDYKGEGERHANRHPGFANNAF